MSTIYGNLVGGIVGFGKTFVLVDEDNNEITGVVVDKLAIFDAKPEDIKIGKVAASESGVIIGTHDCE